MLTGQLSAKTSTLPASPTSVAEARRGLERDDAGSEDQIAEIAGRLERRYPGGGISRSDLEGRARSVYRQFDKARIRTFVAVFVERLVRRSIEQPLTVAPGSAS